MVARVWLAACACGGVLGAVFGGSEDLPPWLHAVLLTGLLAAMSAPLAICCCIGGVDATRLLAMVTGIVVQVVMICCGLGFPAALAAGYAGGVLLACTGRH